MFSLIVSGISRSYGRRERVDRRPMHALACSVGSARISTTFSLVNCLAKMPAKATVEIGSVPAGVDLYEMLRVLPATQLSHMTDAINAQLEARDEQKVAADV